MLHIQQIIAISHLMMSYFVYSPSPSINTRIRGGRFNLVPAPPLLASPHSSLFTSPHPDG